MLSGRMADILSELYFTSAVLKRWQDEGQRDDEFDLVAYNAQRSFARIGVLLDEVIANFPSRAAAVLLRLVTLPGAVGRGPSDALTERCANLISAPGPVRDRMSADLTGPGQHPGIAALNDAFDRSVATDGLRKRLRELGMTQAAALEAGLLTPHEGATLDARQRAVERVIAVDDFAPADLAALYSGATPDPKRPADKRPDPAKEAPP